MRKMKKVMAAMLAATMAMSMSLTAFAAVDEGKEPSYSDQSTVIVIKNYEAANSDTTSPEETFSFSALTCTGVTDAAADITASNAPIPTIGNAVYGKGDAGSATKSKEITITLPEYTSVGIYTYEFRENDGQTAGVSYRETPITLKVTVIEDGGKKRVAAVHTESQGTKSGTFDNTYSAGSLAVSKTVTGLLGDHDKEFTVTVTFTAPEGDTVREAITYVDGTEEKTIPANWDTTATANITLKHGETVTFTNIPYGVTYNVAETDYTDEGYAASYNFSDDNKKIDSASDSVVITNNKGGTVDTGINLDNAPYILLLAIAALGMFGFVSKKRSSEF